LEAAEERDPKGLYKKARAGEIKNFTGIDDPYEAPESPELHLRTDQQSLQEEVDAIIDLLVANNIISA
jgi:adenylylsulfate kinase-like enzyme